MGDKYERNNYVLEKVNQTNGKSVCRWAKTAACVPPQSPDIHRDPRLPEIIKCAKDLECVSTLDGTKCSNTALPQYISRSVEEKRTFAELNDRRMVGKVCACWDANRVINKEVKSRNSGRIA